MTQDIEQRSNEWFAARCGSLGASAIADALSKTKDGKPGSTSQNLRTKLVIERITGAQEDGFKSAAMQYGIDNEGAARLAYEARVGDFVAQTGLHRHPFIDGTHASPDGLVGGDGLVEIKVPNSSTHIETMKSGKIQTKYIYQMQWQMRCTDRQWCDFVSYDPRMPEALRLWVKRVYRDNEKLEELEKGVIEFLKGVQEDVELLQEMAGSASAEEKSAA